MKAKIKIFKKGEHGQPEEVVTGDMEGDPLEMLDFMSQLNARWPGRWAEIEAVREPLPA